MVHFIKSEKPTNVVCSVAFNKKSYFHKEHYSPMLDMGDFYVNVVVTDEKAFICESDLVMLQGEIVQFNADSWVDYIYSDVRIIADKIVATNNPEFTPDSLLEDEVLKFVVHYFNNEGKMPEHNLEYGEKEGYVKITFKLESFPKEGLEEFISSSKRLHKAVEKLKDDVSEEDIKKAAFEFSGVNNKRDYNAFKAGAEWYKQQLEK